jgi:hypothetical protein
MEELGILNPILKRKYNSIPHGVSYWLYFKRHLLEKTSVRKQFQLVLNYQEFRELVRNVANPLKYGPSFCRRKNSEKTNKRNMNDMIQIIWEYYLDLLHPDSPIYVADSTYGGLGIFLRNNSIITAKSLNHYLYGVLFEIEEFEELQENHYPSLFQAHQSKQCILCGPLSVVNHSCGSKLHFSQPKLMKKEEFEGLEAVYCQIIGAKSIMSDKGDELLLNYFPNCDTKPNFFGIACQCGICVRIELRS